jgi:hypothetical protein
MPNAYLVEGAFHCWNVSDRVGWGCANQRSDVLLVQFWLNCAYTQYGNTDFGQYLCQVDCTGVVDDFTVTAVQQVQYLNQKNDGRGVVVDGIVSRMRGGSTFYSHTGHGAQWVIGSLAQLYYGYAFGVPLGTRIQPGDLSNAMDNMWLDPMIPPELSLACAPQQQNWSA